MPRNTCRFYLPEMLWICKFVWMCVQLSEDIIYSVPKKSQLRLVFHKHAAHSLP
jgi:hypothetical protein